MALQRTALRAAAECRDVRRTFDDATDSRVRRGPSLPIAGAEPIIHRHRFGGASAKQSVTWPPCVTSISRKIRTRALRLRWSTRMASRSGSPTLNAASSSLSAKEPSNPPLQRPVASVALRAPSRARR